jgi:hypothetical protein
VGLYPLILALRVWPNLSQGAQSAAAKHDPDRLADSRDKAVRRQPPAWRYGTTRALLRCNSVVVRFHFGCISLTHRFRVGYTSVTRPSELPAGYRADAEPTEGRDRTAPAHQRAQKTPDSLILKEVHPPTTLRDLGGVGVWIRARPGGDDSRKRPALGGCGRLGEASLPKLTPLWGREVLYSRRRRG